MPIEPLPNLVDRVFQINKELANAQMLVAQLEREQRMLTAAIAERVRTYYGVTDKLARLEFRVGEREYYWSCQHLYERLIPKATDDLLVEYAETSPPSPGG